MSEAQANSGGKCDACASGMRLRNGVLKGREKVAGSASEQVVANGDPLISYFLCAFRPLSRRPPKRRMFEGYGKVKPHPMPPGTSNGCLCESKLAWLHTLGVRTSEKTEGGLREAVAVALGAEDPFIEQMLALANWQDKLPKLIPTPIATDFRLLPIPGLPIPILVPVLLPGDKNGGDSSFMVGLLCKSVTGLGGPARSSRRSGVPRISSKSVARCRPLASSRCYPRSKVFWGIPMSFAALSLIMPHSAFCISTVLGGLCKLRCNMPKRFACDSRGCGHPGLFTESDPTSESAHARTHHSPPMATDAWSQSIAQQL